MVTYYRATFVKANGDNREMKFIKLNDLPNNFLDGRIKNKDKQKALTEGHEVVWDIDKNGFRIFNWNTIVGEAEQDDINFQEDV